MLTLGARMTGAAAMNMIPAKAADKQAAVEALKAPPDFIAAVFAFLHQRILLVISRAQGVRPFQSIWRAAILVLKMALQETIRIGRIQPEGVSS